jgi:hypothetical protein
MVKFSGNCPDLFFRFFRERKPQIPDDNLFPVTNQVVYQVIDSIGKYVKDTEWNDAEQEDKGSEKKIGEEFHAAKLIKSINLSLKLLLNVDHSQA